MPRRKNTSFYLPRIRAFSTFPFRAMWRTAGSAVTYFKGKCEVMLSKDILLQWAYIFQCAPAVAARASGCIEGIFLARKADDVASPSSAARRPCSRGWVH